jgi:hypothetical protein
VHGFSVQNLCDSSNKGEKSNDLVVASRQKHGWMSQGKEGSVGLAHICCAHVNGEIHEWAQNKVTQFEPVPVLAKAALVLRATTCTGRIIFD